MKLFLSGLDLIGFTALSITGALAASALSLLRLTVRYLLQCLEKIQRFFRQWKSKMPAIISRAEKNGTKWYWVKIGNWSLMIGRKEND